MNYGAVFSKLYRRAQSYLTVALKPYDLSPAEHLVLQCVAEMEDASQEAIAARLMTDKAIVARAASSLEEKGWIARNRSESDRRAFVLTPLEKCDENIEALTKIGRHWSVFLKEGISEEDLAVFDRVLDQMYQKALDTDPDTIAEEVFYERT